MSIISCAIFSIWYDFDQALKTIVGLTKVIRPLSRQATNFLYKLLVKHNTIYKEKMLKFSNRHIRE